MSRPKGGKERPTISATAFDLKRFRHLPYMDISSSGESPFVVAARTCIAVSEALHLVAEQPGHAAGSHLGEHPPFDERVQQLRVPLKQLDSLRMRQHWHHAARKLDHHRAVPGGKQLWLVVHLRLPSVGGGYAAGSFRGHANSPNGAISVDIVSDGSFLLDGGPTYCVSTRAMRIRA